MIRVWFSGLVRRRLGRVAGAALGVAVAVSLLASLGAFLGHAKATMTQRAIRDVTVDWQVQVHQGTPPRVVARLLQRTAQVRNFAQVGFARTAGLQAATQGTRQTTGPGQVLGLPQRYAKQFPGQLRLLTGTLNGPLLAQQTAANLHVTPGDRVTIRRAGLRPVVVTIAGVVDLPMADSLFQKVGAPPGAQLTAPPDNVVLLPAPSWHASFAPLAAQRPDLVSTQFHAQLAHHLPSDPAAAFSAVTAAAHNFEARSAGGALVGNNLGATLDAARSDAAYAQVLFLFLGLPGAILAALLTAIITAAGRTRRRAEQALLRARGATTRQLTRLAAVETGLVGVVGAGIGLGAATLVGVAAFGTARFGDSATTAIGWGGGAAAVGLIIAAATVLVPARRDLRESTVADARAELGKHPYPPWARYGLDVVLLTVAGLIFWATSRSGYQLVFAPEGVPTLSISYWAFAGPALVWLGAGLLAWRLSDLLLGPGRRIVAAAIRPASGRLAASIASGMSRQRRPLVRSVVLLALALSFAASTAVFNATYRQQAEVDAQLTNGADVTAAAAPGSHLTPANAARLAAVPGVTSVEPIQHRYAYIGPDLQDLYGVRPATISTATALQDSYFQGGTAAALMHTLAVKPSSILVSAETVKDYQLHPGEQLTLRLLNTTTGTPHVVAFHYVGVVSEFPTAPRDSFFVANAAYVARMTGSNATGAFLISTGGQNTGAVASRVRQLLGTSAKVSDIATVRNVVGSSLTSVDLSGLTRVELAFALVLAAASGGLVFALGLAERRRTFAIVTALGAKPRHLRSMIFSEAGALLALGLTAGGVLGWVVSNMLVRVLTGVFDPAPTALAVPWTYLGVAVAITIAALLAVSAAASSLARRSPLVALREL